MDQFIAFAQDRWLLLVVAVVAIIIIIKVIKSLVKWLIIVVIAAAVIVYGANYAGDIQEIGAKLAEYTKDEAVKALLGEAEDATYTASADGSYTVETSRFKLEGSAGSDEAKLVYMGQSITIKLDGALRSFVDSARANSSGT